MERHRIFVFRQHHADGQPARFVAKGGDALLAGADKFVLVAEKGDATSTEGRDDLERRWHSSLSGAENDVASIQQFARAGKIIINVCRPLKPSSDGAKLILSGGSLMPVECKHIFGLDSVVICVGAATSGAGDFSRRQCNFGPAAR